MLGLKVAVVEGIQQEIHQIRHNCLGALGFQQLHNVVVGQRREFHKDFPYNAHLWLLYIQPWESVKIADNPLYIASEFYHGGIFLGQGGNAAGLPFHVKGIGTAWLCLIGPGGIKHPHEDIPVHNGLHGFCQQRHGEGEAGICLHSVGVDRDNRYLGHSRLFQGPADEADVVGCAAAAAGLAHEDSRVVQVIFA